ncbi:hypothetical protein [Actinacidiphila sp. bgisy145]|uniref:hypothetical protein n=1 Tax=Actinacidiphila sp. bgisy145 TaxID=3413792 RepID=UPI003EB6B73C
MTDDDLSPTENRIVRGCDQLRRSCTAWLTATDLPAKERVPASIGRALGGIIAAGFTGGVAYELGPIAWATAGVLTALSVWVAGTPNPDNDEDQDDEVEPDDQEPGSDEQLLDVDAFTELVLDVACGANVHLRTIRMRLIEETERPWADHEVTALCRAAGIPTRPGVRVPGAQPAVTTGIHHTDLPPLPDPSPGAPVDGVAAGQHDNNNTNTPHVERIGEGGAVIKNAPLQQEAVR